MVILLRKRVVSEPSPDIPPALENAAAYVDFTQAGGSLPSGWSWAFGDDTLLTANGMGGIGSARSELLADPQGNDPPWSELTIMVAGYGAYQGASVLNYPGGDVEALALIRTPDVNNNYAGWFLAGENFGFAQTALADDAISSFNVLAVRWTSGSPGGILVTSFDAVAGRLQNEEPWTMPSIFGETVFLDANMGSATPGRVLTHAALWSGHLADEDIDAVAAYWGYVAPM